MSPHPSEAPPPAGAAHQFVKGVLWVTAATYGARLIGIFGTLVLARLLTPSQFGLVNLASLVVFTLGMVQEMGFGPALVHIRRVREAAPTAFTLMCVNGVVIGLAVYYAGPSVAAFFHMPEAGPLMQFFALLPILNSFGYVSCAMLESHLEYRKVARAELWAAVTYVCVAIVAAGNGFGPWSLAFAELGRTGVKVGLLLLGTGWTPRFALDWPVAKSLFRYGRHTVASAFLVFIALNIDNFMVGKWFGAWALGVYAMAFNVSQLPATEISGVIRRVTFPVLTRLRDDVPAMRAAFLRIMRMLGILLFPVSVAIAALAPLLVKVFLGTKWMEAVPLVEILGLYGLIRGLGGLFGSVAMAVGRPETMAPLNLLQIALSVVAVIFCLPLGVWGIGLAVTIAMAGVNAAAWCVLVKLIHIRLRDLHVAVWPSLPAAAVLGVALWWGSVHVASVWQWLLALIAGGTVLYMGLLVLLGGRPLLLEVQGIMAMALSRRAARPSPQAAAV